MELIAGVSAEQGRVIHDLCQGQVAEILQDIKARFHQRAPIRATPDAGAEESGVRDCEGHAVNPGGDSNAASPNPRVRPIQGVIEGARPIGVGKGQGGVRWDETSEWRNARRTELGVETRGTEL